MTWEEYVAAWSKLHGGFDPTTATPVVRGWVRLAYRIGSWLGRRGVGPTAVTAAGLALCLAVPFAALLGRGGLLLGALLVLLASFADGLDGAVAVVTGRTSRLGFVYDSVADRLGEVGWLTGFYVAGVPGWLVVAAGGVSWLHEYVRARATASGMSDIGTVTLGERPTRVSIAISGLLLAGMAGFVHDTWAPTVLIVAAATWFTLAVVGLAQLAVAVRRALVGDPGSP
ncbi:CDP-alcohol phosphatidyltransferase family protein [Micromonosporaceae bacterium Da 78-11]